MATKTFIINEFTGSDTQVEVILTDGIAGEVLVDLKVLSDTTGNIGDLVGFFADFDGFTVGEQMTIEQILSSPATINGTSESSGGNFTLFLDDSGSTTDGITDVSNNVNLNGEGVQRTYQLGVQIGTGGLGQGDDYQTVRFKLTGTGLDISKFSKVGVRLQSVGTPGSSRDGSSKLEGIPTPPTFSISGQKFEDLTGNGKTDDDIAWSYGAVSLYIDDDGSGTFTAGDRFTTTDANGNWSIDGLTLADVGKKIFEVVPTGSQQTGVEFQVVDAPDSSGIDKNNNFTNFKLFNISGTKFLDKTGNGITTDDDKLAGVEIFIDSDGSGSYTAGEQITTTAADGTWSFNNLSFDVLGKQVYEVLPTGYVQTVGNAGYTLPTTGGQDLSNLNFANFKLFNVSGIKYLDKTGNGITTDDGILAGVQIFIDSDESGSYTPGETMTTTAADGSWSFGNLSFDVLGKKVLETLPDGYVQTVGNTGYTLDGTDKIDLDFANFKLFNVSGTKFLDNTGDGISSDDIGLGGIDIFIDKNDNKVFDLGEVKTTTAADGTWSFSNLSFDVLGKQVYEVLPPGYVQTVGKDGYTLPTTGGQDLTNLNFANFKPKGPGVGTIGFWKQWTAVWDGNTSNDSTFNTKAKFAKKDILYQVTDPVSGNQTAPNSTTANTTNRGLLIGDFNKNGITDAGESTIYYSVAEAQSILNASGSTDGQDARYILAKQLIGAWLNVLADNTYETIVGTVKPDINNGVKWLQKYTPAELGSGTGGTDAIGDGSLTLNAAAYKVSSSSTAWNSGSGNAIKNVLDAWNNTGLGISLSRDTNTIGSLDQLNTLHAAYPYQTFS
jgi:hypothetical protein